MHSHSQVTHEHFAEDVDDQVDPHHFSGGHKHGHVVLPIFTLRAVLAILLVLTGLTVLLAQSEVWFQNTFNVVLPHWLNVVIAMSIAVVKSAIVAAYFMQLRYDNPINTVIFLFCLFALALFLGFTIIDLTGRGYVTPWKQGEVVAGGTGNFQRFETVPGADPKAVTVAGPIYKFAREQEVELVGPVKFAELEHAAHAAHAHPEHPARPSNQSRVRTGLTPGLFDTAAPAAEHGAEPSADHGKTGGH